MKYIIRRGLFKRKVADETGNVVACIRRGFSGISVSGISGTGPVELIVTHTPSVRHRGAAVIHNSYHAILGGKSIAFASTGNTLLAQRQLNVSTSFGKFLLTCRFPASDYDIWKNDTLVGRICTGIWKRNFVSNSLTIPVEICCILYAFAVFLKEE